MKVVYKSTLAEIQLAVRSAAENTLVIDYVELTEGEWKNTRNELGINKGNHMFFSNSANIYGVEVRRGD